MLIDIPKYIECTNHSIDQIKVRCYFDVLPSKKDIAREYLDNIKSGKIFFIPDYQADFNGKDRNFRSKYYGIMELFSIPMVVVIGVTFSGNHVMLTLYPYDLNASRDFEELYGKHKKFYKSDPDEIPIKPKSIRKDRSKDLMIKSNLFGKQIDIK